MNDADHAARRPSNRVPSRGPWIRTVEEYVRHLVEADAGSLNGPSQREDEDFYAGWQDRFDELLSSLKPGNPDVDDSRESIYRDR
jgi:hypothetical protein